MFENLKRALGMPFFELVNSYYTPSVLAGLISSELEAASDDVLLNTADLKSYLTGWIMACRRYGEKYNLQDVYRISSSEKYEEMTNKLFDIVDDEVLKEYLYLSEGRKLFVSLYQKALQLLLSKTIPEQVIPSKDVTPPLFDYRKVYDKLKSALDMNICGQDEAKRALIVGIIKLLIRIQHPELNLKKSNILLVGPSGCGKTEMVRVISQALDLPMVIEDASKFTAAGYRGRDASDMIEDLLIKAGYDVKAAEHGIIYIDEIDKLCLFDSGSIGHDYKISDQTTFLTLLESDEITVNIRGRGAVNIKTDNILFISGGAFSVKNMKETDRMSVGFLSPFSSVSKESDTISHTDLIRYGMTKELAGRLSTIVRFRPLNVDDLYRIATGANGIMSGYEKMLSLLGEEQKISEEEIRKLCIEAYSEGIGARGLKTIFDKYFEEQIFKALQKSIINSESQKEENSDETESKPEESSRGFQTMEV